jgi:rubrerythrin
MNDLKFALKMEKDGEKYYMQQAEINQDNSLHAVCLMLAADEKNHARILTDKMNTNSFRLEDADTLAKAKNIFEDAGDIKIAGKATATQTDFYRIASGMEKQSIDLYTEYLSKAEGAEEKALFEYLIEQEKQHFMLLDELAEWLRRADEWVENAEFGIREEY